MAIISNTAAPVPGTLAPDGDWPSPGRAWYALVIFALTLMVNILDRGILALLIPPIKADLHLSDTQVSLLIGFAFVIFYAIMGLPIARLIDTRSRRLILGVCVSIWAGMTALSGLAQNFWQLFWCRVMVGVGEAGSGPATYSMMADLFPRNRLPRAISVLNFGFVAGQGIALVVGGLVIKLVADLPEVTLPVIGTLRSWQLALIAVGLPGLVIAALMSTVPEPKRRGMLVQQPGVKVKALPIRQVTGFLKENRSTYLPMMVGANGQLGGRAYRDQPDGRVVPVQCLRPLRRRRRLAGSPSGMGTGMGFAI